jgi:hypothetical protein
MKKYIVFKRTNRYGISFEFKFSSNNVEDARDFANLMNRNREESEKDSEYIVVAEIGNEEIVVD